MKTSPAYPGRLSMPQWRPHFVLTLLLALIISACGGGGGGGFTPTPPPPTLSANDSGAVYVFTPDAAAAFAQQAYIKASNTDAGDVFGNALALSGDTLAVGANGEASAATGIDGDQSDNSASQAGAAYVFTRDAAGVWSQQAYIKASNTDADDFFGDALALSGDTLVVGAVGEASAATGIDGDQSDNTAARGVFNGAGAAYVFTRDAAGVWSQQAYIKASNTDGIDGFGSSVALSGDTLVVGANGEASAATGIDGDQSDNTAARGGFTGAGAAYVFTRDAAGVWSQQAYIKASNTDGIDGFGFSVALSGDTLAVGALGEASAATGIDGDQSDNTAARGDFASAGAVYVFTRDDKEVVLLKGANNGALRELQCDGDRATVLPVQRPCPFIEFVSLVRYLITLPRPRCSCLDTNVVFLVRPVYANDRRKLREFRLHNSSPKW